jgi:hydroxymethylbilane synthase
VKTLRLGSRGSQLALFQARLVAERIRSAGGPACEIVVIRTSGDRFQDTPLSDIGGKRLFVKEIEDALISGDVDLAVHSSKDMPAVLPDGLEVGAVLEREDPRDALVLGSDPRTGTGDRRDALVLGSDPRTGTEDPGDAVVLGSDPRTGTGVRPHDLAGIAAWVSSGRIGTGSVRRIAQLKAVFPAASFANVRGNLDTRLRKLDSGDYDLLVLAAAGLRRLGFGARISAPVPVETCVPAPGQGIIAIEIRTGDAAAREAVLRVNDDEASAALEAERALVTALGGGCQMPVGGIAQPVGTSDLELLAVVTSLDGARVIRYKKTGPRADAAALGRAVAAELVNRGAADILNEVRVPDSESRQLT